MKILYAHKQEAVGMEHNITFLPGGQSLRVTHGTSMREAFIQGKIDFDFPCGRGACGKCRIRITKGVPAPSEKEVQLLGADELEKGVRLACYTTIGQDMEAVLPVRAQKEHNILLSGLERSYELSPLVKKHYFEMEMPSLHDQRPDWERLKACLAAYDSKYRDIKIKIPLLYAMPELIRRSDYGVTVLTDGSEVLGIEKGNTVNTLMGVAFDIGTTTIVAYLMDLNTGKELAVASALNPQVQFGADVISRTSYANQGENELKTLHAFVVEKVDALIGEVAEKGGIDRNDIYAVTVAGNTCMHHFFTGLSPKYIGLLPYIPVVREALSFRASDFNIRINPAGLVFTLPNIAAYVGGDTAAVVLSTQMDRSEDIKLAIDIGTNGELVMGSSGRLIACSTAAGPAFEGAHISCGMRGTEGAVDHVRFDGKLSYTVIGETRPQGICGSALLDVAAGLIELGIINSGGKIQSPAQVGNEAAKPYLRHIIEYDGANAFLLADERETSHGRRIMLTQDDIRSLQLAKGAIAAGIKVLMERLGVTLEDIAEVLLAGAFGNYMNAHSACTVGLIPRELEKKIRVVGNAAGAGARLALLSEEEYRHARELSERVEYYELGAHKNFMYIFAQSTRF